MLQLTLINLFALSFSGILIWRKKPFFIGSDHAGFELKEKIEKWLKKKEIVVKDVGTFNNESVDYPDIAAKLARNVAKTKKEGILICGTGIGVSIAANKVKGVRAALAHDALTAKMAKQHNNANVLCLGGRIHNAKAAEKIVNAWLSAEFEGGRHERRVKKIHGIEK